jgi:transmembrane sensor
VQRRRQLCARGMSFGYRHGALTLLGLAAAGLLALTARALTEKPGVPVSFESRAEREPDVSPSGKSVLVAGDTVTLGGDSTRVQRLAAEDLRNTVAWTAGVIRLDGETLTEAVAEFNRYNRRKLTIADPTIAGLHVSGTFKAREPESFVATLARSGGVRALTLGSRASDSQVIRLVGAGTAR